MHGGGRVCKTSEAHAVPGKKLLTKRCRSAKQGFVSLIYVALVKTKYTLKIKNTWCIWKILRLKPHSDERMESNVLHSFVL